MEGYGTSPAQLLMSRRTKTKLPISEHLLRPRVVDNVAEKIQKRQSNQRKHYDKGAQDLSPLQKGDVIRMQPFELGQKKWTKAQVMKQVGPRSYEVQSEGNTYVQNRKHIRKSAEKPPVLHDNSLQEEATPEPVFSQPDCIPTEESEHLPSTVDPPAINRAPSGEPTRTRSCRVSIKPVRFQDYVTD